MEFHTFYDYFLYTKNWAYVMMFVTLPVYVLYWNTVLFPKKGPWLFGDDDEHSICRSVTAWHCSISRSDRVDFP